MDKSYQAIKPVGPWTYEVDPLRPGMTFVRRDPKTGKRNLIDVFGIRIWPGRDKAGLIVDEEWDMPKGMGRIEKEIPTFVRMEIVVGVPPNDQTQAELIKKLMAFFDKEFPIPK